MSSAETTILWDFDNTLFRTREFWRAELFPAYAPMGILPETVEEAFKEATSVTYDYFVPDAILGSLAKRTNRSKDELAPILERIVHTDLGKPFFFNNALNVVRHEKEKGYQQYLVSYGDRGFKERWFSSLGLGSYFEAEEIVITDKKKPEMLHSLILRDSVIIVNDVLPETEAMRDALLLMGKEVVAYHFAPKSATVSLNGNPQLVTFSEFSELGNYL